MTKCAIIGSTKIAEIHTREFLKNGITDITVLSRNKKKSKKFSENLSKKFNKKIKFSNHIEIKNKKFDVISICSNSKYHLNHLNKIKNPKAKILVEKPLFPIKDINNIKKKLDYLYIKHPNLFVCYPMYYLITSFLKHFDLEKKIERISVYYQTRGKNRGNEIFFDLAPHVLIIVMQILKKMRKIQVLNKKIEKKTFTTSFKSLDTHIKIRLLQLKNRKKSVFKFSINNNEIKRITKIQNGIFINLIEYKNKRINLINPMSLVIKKFIKNSYKSKEFIKNKNLTYSLLELTKDINDQRVN